ncbi:ion channel [Paenibacillus sp. LHD-117]|uniref:potassium channel protein n=1 Tax=Paenibacillus sp. LHD-117 TaxID=3071412 RepID=UPI0027DFB943|nr:ion channel [Paenibacillus sp. LHD-117]MDQ6420032.1 ion channel [Paenibacillus sp. LHD-117]
MLFLRLLSARLLRISHAAIAATVILFAVFGATFALLIEPETFGTWFNAFYWVLTTMATVGYGDYFAVTQLGKAFTIFLYIFGIGLLSLVIGKIIDSFAILKQKRGAGELSYQGYGHIVIINWSKKAQTAVEEILSHSPKTDIVIIDDGIGKHPMEHLHQVHFVKGDPSEDEILERAAIGKARSAIIFADMRIDEGSLIDGKSLLITSSIERMAHHVHTTVEIVHEKHIRNFKHAEVNEFVLTHDAISHLAVRSAMQEGNTDLLRQLMSRQDNDDIYEVPRHPSWKTYGDAFKALLEQGATLIADRSDMGINRKLSSPIPGDARLFMICDKATYERLAAH